MYIRSSWLSAASLVLVFVAAGARAQAASPWLAQWIWHPRGDVKEAVFRKTFDVRPPPADARLALTADDRYALYVNGTLVREKGHWQSIEVFDITPHLRVGRNVIAIRAANDGGAAGLLVEGSITYTPTDFTPILSDDTWKVEHRQMLGSADPGFDDSAWAAAAVVARPPGGPWGEFFHPQTLPPLSARIENLAWAKRPVPGQPMQARFDLVPNAPIPGGGPIEFMLRDAWGEIL
jgi:hypothetical protein